MHEYDRTREYLWVPEVKAFFFCFGLHLSFRKLYYCLFVCGYPVFRSQKQGKAYQNIHGSQNFIQLIFSISLGHFKRRLRTTALVHLIHGSGYAHFLFMI